jgi:hypothetical protein
MTYHGESNIVRWELLSGTPDSLLLGVTLPHCAVRFEREMRCAGYVIYFSETANNLSAWDRPVGWCEHVTLGPPFLEAGWAGIESNLTRGFRTGDLTLDEFRWPEGRGARSHLLTGFDAAPHSDLVNSFLVDPGSELGYFAAWHRGLGLLFGYVFPRREFPWMNVWQDHTDLRRTRGMEFSNTPIDGTMRQLARCAAIWGVPTHDWLDAKGTLRKSYAAFATAVPMGFAGVAEISIAGNELRITEKLTGNVLALNWVPPAGHGMAQS